MSRGTRPSLLACALACACFLAPALANAATIDARVVFGPQSAPFASPWHENPPAPARATFNPDDVLSEDVMHDSSSMTQADVQAFLEAMPGALDAYASADHSGTVKPASQIVWEAGQGWDVSPKLLLALLQKEQSLLTMPKPSKARLDKAVGCGVYPGSKNRYVGFGNQLWNAARKLSAYPKLYKYKPGVKKSVYGKKTVTPANAATFSMYTYNPSINGNRNWWRIYGRYFGDPHERVWRKTVYRFRDPVTGEYVFTGSEGVRWSLAMTPTAGVIPALSPGTIDALPGAVAQGGLAVSAEEGAGQPVYAVFDRTIGSWLYALSQAEADAIVARRPERYEARGVAFWVIR
jgi:hypothetical protein